MWIHLRSHLKKFLRNVVKFKDGCFKVFKKHYLSMYLDSYEKTDLKAVGNIFDNPKLLKYLCIWILTKKLI